MMQDFDPLKNPSLQKALNGLRQLSTSLRSASGSLAPAFDQRSQPDAFDPLHVPANDARAQPDNNSSGSSVQYNAQLQIFRDELRRGVSVDLTNLRAFAFHGIPDQGPLRAMAWKLLLGYLPADQTQWVATLQSKRAEYARFCKDLIINPNGIGRTSSAEAEQDTKDPLKQALWTLDVSETDHPLSTASNSKWREFFKDNEVLEQIDRDVRRTHPDMHFFSGDDPSAVRHRQDMCRALFIFAKLNPGLTYVQGMNELYAPLYYLCSHNSNGSGDAVEHAEADAWYCFVDLISDFRDHFCKQLDNSTMGIRATLSRLNSQLKAADRELWYHLDVKNKVNPQFYAFRWITLLLTQEFSFPDVMRLWDTLLSDPAGRSDCLLRLCIAMLTLVRQELLSGDFSANLKLLQRYPSVDVHDILQRAQELSRA